MNRMNDISRFVRQWDSALVTPPDRSQLSSLVNLSGDAKTPVAVIFPPWHSGFWPSIEEGIFTLAEILVWRLGLITYSSCQGHLLGDNAVTPRHIGIIPRSVAEHQWILRVLSLPNSTIEKHEKCIHDGIAVDCLGVVIEGDNESRNAVDLVFRKGPNISAATYFVGLAEKYRIYTEVLDDLTRATSPNRLADNPSSATIKQWARYASAEKTLRDTDSLFRGLPP